MYISIVRKKKKTHRFSEDCDCYILIVNFYGQAKKDSEFTDVRTTTEFCEEALQTALSQVKEVN